MNAGSGYGFGFAGLARVPGSTRHMIPDPAETDQIMPVTHRAHRVTANRCQGTVRPNLRRAGCGAHDTARQPWLFTLAAFVRWSA